MVGNGSIGKETLSLQVIFMGSWEQQIRGTRTILNFYFFV